MKLVTLLAKVNNEKCIGCQTCAKVCPTLAINVENRKAIINADTCRACGNCEQRCPVYAIELVKREEPLKISVSLEGLDKKKIDELCRKANFNPEQILCYCTETRAQEVAAAILKGAHTPETISLETGIRTGCSVECIQPVLRMLKAAEITPERPNGYQWYGLTPTLWDIPEETKEKYSKSGFYFDGDIKLLEELASAKTSEEEGK